MNIGGARGTRRTVPRIWLGAVLLATGLAWTAPAPAVAAGGGGNGGDTGGGSARVEDPDYTAGVKAIKAQQYSNAIGHLEKSVARDGQNADAYNWLGYAIRKNGEPAKSIPIYEKALALNPKHRGAHEYIGEAYLALDNLPKAKEHLSRLNALCFFPCSEYRDLKKAVDAYEKSGGKVKPTAGH
jgi:tetratricopeptide (TPR) repeat protein